MEGHHSIWSQNGIDDIGLVVAVGSVGDDGSRVACNEDISFSQSHYRYDTPDGKLRIAIKPKQPCAPDAAETAESKQPCVPDAAETAVAETAATAPPQRHFGGTITIAASLDGESRE